MVVEEALLILSKRLYQLRSTKRKKSLLKPVNCWVWDLSIILWLTSTTVRNAIVSCPVPEVPIAVITTCLHTAAQTRLVDSLRSQGWTKMTFLKWSWSNTWLTLTAKIFPSLWIFRRMCKSRQKKRSGLLLRVETCTKINNVLRFSMMSSALIFVRSSTILTWPSSRTSTRHWTTIPTPNKLSMSRSSSVSSCSSISPGRRNCLPSSTTKSSRITLSIKCICNISSTVLLVRQVRQTTQYP